MARSALYLAEHFEIWQLGAMTTLALEEQLDRIAPRRRFRDLAEHSARWHHQLRESASQRPVGYVVSSHSRVARQWQIERISFSPTARKIAAAIDLAGSPNIRRGVVRLVTIPSLDLSALWTERARGDDLCLIDAASYLKMRGGRQHRWFDFMSALSGKVAAHAARQRPAGPPRLPQTRPPAAGPG